MDPAALQLLRSPVTIRARCRNVLQAGKEGKLRHFRVDMNRLPEAVRRTREQMQQRYPSGKIPTHGRLLHFGAGGRDRVAELSGLGAGSERGHRLFELVVLSVLMDAGAGAQWTYQEAQSGRRLGRSEGLAVASLRAFQAGLFSSDPHDKVRVDARALAELSSEKVQRAFQHGESNRLLGMEGRVELLRALGRRILEAPEWFAGDGRLAGLVQGLKRVALREAAAAGLQAAKQGLAAEHLLPALLEALGPIWPSRTRVGTQELGDVWPHEYGGGEGSTECLVPLHKLPQWLSYSVIEVLEWCGLPIVNGAALTGLAEYRNGGLFIDTGVLSVKGAAALRRAHSVSDELVIEWRALTVALLDELARLLREQLGRTEDELPLGEILEGGTWSAGRALASELRPPNAPPPLLLKTDGTLF